MKVTEEEISRALDELTLDQADELDEALREDETRSYWSHTKCLRWMHQEAIRRGWISG